MHLCHRKKVELIHISLSLQIILVILLFRISIFLNPTILRKFKGPYKSLAVWASYRVTHRGAVHRKPPLNIDDAMIFLCDEW